MALINLLVEELVIMRSTGILSIQEKIFQLKSPGMAETEKEKCYLQVYISVK